MRRFIPVHKMKVRYEWVKSNGEPYTKPRIAGYGVINAPQLSKSAHARMIFWDRFLSWRSIGKLEPYEYCWTSTSDRDIGNSYLPQQWRGHHRYNYLIYNNEKQELYIDHHGYLCLNNGKPFGFTYTEYIVINIPKYDFRLLTKQIKIL